jgi:DNA-binding transcriptional ArsR family regulator
LELAEYAQISAGTANWHMKRLASAGLITPSREGQFVRYRVNGNAKEILNLVRGYHPSVWANWVDRFANALTEVSAASSDNETGDRTEVDSSNYEENREQSK